MIPPLVELALRYYRDPLAYGHLADGGFPLPVGFSEQFSALCYALSPLHIDATAQSLDSSPAELQTAARFFARHVLLDPAADHYRALGVSPCAPHALIREHYLFLIKLFHPDRLPAATAADLACSRRINLAYKALSDADRRSRSSRGPLGAKARIRVSHPRDFYGPHRVPIKAADGPARVRPARAAWRLILALGAAGLVLAALGIGLWAFEPVRPLRVAAQPTAPEPPRPHYLQQAKPPLQAAGGALSNVPAPAVLPGNAGASATAKAPQGRVNAAAIGARIVNELQIAARRGDVATLAALCAESFPLGPEQLRSLMAPVEAPPAKRAPPAKSLDRRWLALDDMQWQSVADGRIKGRGRVLVSTGGEVSATAQRRHGTVELELIPVAADYRINRLQIRDD
jgi:hypothetical protein